MNYVQRAHELMRQAEKEPEVNARRELLQRAQILALLAIAVNMPVQA